MISFILNQRQLDIREKPGQNLLDFIRYQQDLTGTKIGCREGDCGACTVLEGRLRNNELVYRSIISCLTPLGNVHGKHIVTIEGLNLEQLSPVQENLLNHGATQCGFCTPGFVISLTGHTMSSQPSSTAAAIASVDGNICRCTGYKSIERAAISISHLLKDKDPERPLQWLVNNRFLPPYFAGIGKRLSGMAQERPPPGPAATLMGGGTDLMVQQPHNMARARLDLLFDKEELKDIRAADQQIIIGASATASDIMQSSLLQKHLPRIGKHFKRVSSEPIRNMGTLGGNIANASPIADLVIYFMVLGARLRLVNGQGERTLPLSSFFIDYKKTRIKKGEFIHSISLPLTGKPYLHNFEKVSKRTHLDIATVNSAMLIEVHEDQIVRCMAACGGVSPIPRLLKNPSAFLTGNRLTAANLRRAAEVLQTEIAPISDVRGSAQYKRLLARQLFMAHFLELFPGRFALNELIS